jgi:hypothetical protein
MSTSLGDGSGIVACLRSCYLATGLFAKPFGSNGCLSAGFKVFVLGKYVTLLTVLTISVIGALYKRFASCITRWEFESVFIV